MKQQFNCRECGTEFTRTRSTQLFCCDNCRYTWHNRVKTEKLKFADEKGFDEEVLHHRQKEEWF